MYYTDEKQMDEEEKVPGLDIDIEHKIDVFRGIESIDEKTAVLLYDNGCISIDDLKNGVGLCQKRKQLVVLRNALNAKRLVKLSAREPKRITL